MSLRLPFSTPSLPVRDGISLGLVCIAFSVSIFHYGGDSNLWLTCAFVALLLACLVRIQPVWGGAEFYWSPIHWWIVAYVLWLVVLIWLSTLPENTLIFARMMSAFGLVFLLCTNLPRAIWLRVLIGFLLAGLVSACWGIGEYIMTAKRANGPLVDPSAWSSLHNLFFFGTLAVFLTTGNRYRWLLGFALFVFAVAVFCSYSRVATAVFMAALALVFIVTIRYVDIRARLISAVLVSVLAWGLVHGYASQDEASHSEGYTLDLEEQGWSQRLSMWRAGLALYADYPVTGSGPATFKVHYPQYRDAGDLKNLGNYVHNDYIQYLAEGGPLLLGFLLAFTGYLLYRLYRGASKLVRGDRGELESVLLIVAMGTSLVHGLMNFVLYQFPVIMLMGFYFGRTVRLQATGRMRRLEVTTPLPGRAASVLVVVLLAGIAILDELSNDLIYQHRITHEIERDSLAYFDAIRWLTILRGANSSNQFALATLYRMRFDQEPEGRTGQTLALAAAMKYERGLELNPFRDQVRKYYAQFLMRNSWLQEHEEIHSDPETLLREGLRLGPVFARNHLALADYLAKRGAGDEAYQVLRNWACQWARLKYPGYHGERLDLFKRLLRESRQRNDTEIQRHMLRVLERA
ncbi:MAG: O-antigen ligase family protein [Pseudomonadales bacterium]